jgi:chlorobactene glucosyltransferase
MSIYLAISTIFFLAGLIILHWLHNQYHLDIVVESTSPPINAPLISVCIPARNEERNIRACVEAVLAQDYPNFEVIVLDDRSTDGTSTILADIASHDSRLRPISGSNLPKGWAGKPHALFQASAIAHDAPGAWLCFIDADTFISPPTLSSCYFKAIETQADMFTILTFQVMGSFWEKVVLPLVMTGLSAGFSPRKVNDPKRTDAIANGQFILVKRSVYYAIGGHESVKSSIVEDKAIAEQVKWNGYRLIVADGMQLARTRMYTSLPEMWEGWTKNIYLGLRDQLSLMALGIFGAFLAMIVSLFMPAWPILGVLWYLNGGGWMALTVILESLWLWAYLLYARSIIALKMEISPWYSLTTPLGAAIFGAMMLISTWNVVSRKGVTWKGRVYTFG